MSGQQLLLYGCEKLGRGGIYCGKAFFSVSALLSRVTFSARSLLFYCHREIAWVPFIGVISISLPLVLRL
jgi:hypothetical protein